MDRAANGIGITTGSKQEGRLGGWHGSNQKNVPRILVFIMGGKFIIELPCVVYLHIYSLVIQCSYLLFTILFSGATHSELRVGYEITADRKKRTMGSADWDVVIGGSEILTPEKFLRNLKNL